MIIAPISKAYRRSGSIALNAEVSNSRSMDLLERLRRDRHAETRRDHMNDR